MVNNRYDIATNGKEERLDGRTDEYERNPYLCNLLLLIIGAFGNLGSGYAVKIYVENVAFQNLSDEV